jgi:hypothetical protein
MKPPGAGFFAPNIFLSNGALGHCDKQSGIIPNETPDLSGWAFNCASPLPHECSVPLPPVSMCPPSWLLAPFASIPMVFWLSASHIGGFEPSVIPINSVPAHSGMYRFPTHIVPFGDK